MLKICIYNIWHTSIECVHLLKSTCTVMVKVKDRFLIMLHIPTGHHHDITPWHLHSGKCHDGCFSTIYSGHTIWPSKSPKIMATLIFYLWPDLRIHARYCQGQPSYQILDQFTILGTLTIELYLEQSLTVHHSTNFLHLVHDFKRKKRPISIALPGAESLRKLYSYRITRYPMP